MASKLAKTLPTLQSYILTKDVMFSTPGLGSSSPRIDVGTWYRLSDNTGMIVAVNLDTGSGSKQVTTGMSWVSGGKVSTLFSAGTGNSLTVGSGSVNIAMGGTSGAVFIVTH